MNTASLSYILPILLVIISNVAYHTISKQTPAAVNPFLSCGITYAVALVVCGVLFAITKKDGVVTELHRVNYTSIVLGLTVVGLEGGFLLAYRAGWPVNRASLLANLCVALILLFVGLFFYKEGLSIKQWLGVALCIAGVFLVNQ